MVAVGRETPVVYGRCSLHLGAPVAGSKLPWSHALPCGTQHLPGPSPRPRPLPLCSPNSTRGSSTRRSRHIPGCPTGSAITPYPGVSYWFSSAQAQPDLVASLGPLFLFVLLGIYPLLAMPLRSYNQPLIIMPVLPFALVGRDLRE